MPVVRQFLVIQSKFGLMFFSQLLVGKSGKLAIYQISSLICLIFSFIAKMFTSQQVSTWMRAHLERELAQVKEWVNWHVGFDQDIGLWSNKFSDLGVLQRELNKCNHLKRQARQQWISDFYYLFFFSFWLYDWLSDPDCPSIMIVHNITGQFL